MEPSLANGEGAVLTALVMAASTAAAGETCPDMAGVWSQPDGKRIMVLEQAGCRLSGTVQEPQAVLQVRGFWAAGAWTMAATRTSADGCGTTAWGWIRADGSDRMLITVRGSDGLCGGPTEFNATMTYLRKTPPREGT